MTVLAYVSPFYFIPLILIPTQIIVDKQSERFTLAAELSVNAGARKCSRSQFLVANKESLLEAGGPAARRATHRHPPRRA